MRIPKKFPIGMSTKTAACGIVATLSLSGMLLMSGAQIGSEGATFSHVLLAVLGTFMLGITLFSAWNAGRASGDDGRDYGDDSWGPVPPLGGESLKSERTKSPEQTTTPQSI